MKVQVFSFMIRAWIKYGVRKGLRYRANAFSWFVADIALYASIILMYLLLFSAFDYVGTYSVPELGLYISTYFLINNLYAVFFAESVSAYAEAIYSGAFSYYQINPVGTLWSVFLLNFNFPALLITPCLVALNIFCVAQFPETSAIHIIAFYFSIIFASLIMLLFFLLLSSLLLFGIRSSAIESAFMQLFSMAEKPDTTFHPIVRQVFTYVIPAFMFSAVPTRIILNNHIGIETLCLWCAPVLLYFFYRLLEIKGERKYQQSGF